MQPPQSRAQQIAEYWKQNDYYDRAECADWLARFWAEKSEFRRLFDLLDRTTLAELACGHGRHAAQILKEDSDASIRVFHLLDVNQENIDHCKKRFAVEPRIHLAKNNGHDLVPLAAASISGIFCFDAMVHFEYDCVISYVNDAFRVLRPGGRALFHHSNFTSNPGGDWGQNPHGRNFMSRNLFSHVAQRVGFSVREQVILDWGLDAQLDCLSLIEKPETGITRV
jgi:SAM-dependent methyltransferase